MSGSLLTTLGVLVLLLVAYDVYATILHARGRGGPVSEALNRGVWSVVRRVAFGLPRTRRHRLLNAVGPLLLPGLIALYITLLVFGFALVYYPRMPSHFRVAEGAEFAGTWFQALYFSGVTLTTVGYGDITPATTTVRAVALFEGAAGFTLISLAVAYLVAVYRALERKRTVALSFYHQAEEGADVAGFIAHHFVGGRFHGLEGALRMAARDLQALLESHFEHPIVHYFHPAQVYKGLPRVLFLTLETATVIQDCLDPEEYPELCRHPEVRTLEASARHVLRELVGALGLERNARPHRESPTDEERRWRQRFQQTLERLKRAGIKTRQDLDAGWAEYRLHREDWEAPLRRFASYLGYDWEEVTGDRDLEYAADEEKEAPQAEK